MDAEIEVPAQYGGTDGAGVVRPYVMTLRALAQHRTVVNVPFEKLAIVFRVDGAINTFGFSGAKHAKLDRRGIYLSVDIGVSRADMERFASGGMKQFLVDSVVSSTKLFRKIPGSRLTELHIAAIDAQLRAMCFEYEADAALS